MLSKNEIARRVNEIMLRHNTQTEKGFVDRVRDDDFDSEESMMKEYHFYLELAIENCCIANEVIVRGPHKSLLCVDFGTCLIVDSAKVDMNEEIDGEKRYKTFAWVDGWEDQ